MKSSIVEKDIGPHEHEVDIWDSYEIYAVCRLCRMHDWSGTEGSSVQMIDYFKQKYPKNPIVINILEEDFV